MVAAAVDTVCEMDTDSGWLGIGPGILASPCKGFDFWLCNPSVSGSGGSGPRRLSGMPRECTWITAREEVCSEGGGNVPEIQILGANDFDDLPASRVIVWTFFLRVGVPIGKVGVTVEYILSGAEGTRHWTGDQEAAVVVVAEEYTDSVDREGWLPACRDT